jgi:N6-L-threonylcarbamoyladenine synthase
MIILGVESTAHTFGVGIITDQGKVLANSLDSYSSPNKGMIPNEIADHHNEVAQIVLANALKESGVAWNEIEFIAYSAGPGLDPALWAGYHIAKKWADHFGKKLVGVNHCCAHLSIGKVWNKLDDPCYLYVSGVNTQIIIYDGGKYRVIGETLDIGLGNMLDKFGRVLGLGFPAGAKIEEFANGGNYVELPYVVKGMDVSFSGILTKALQLFEREQASKKDLCFSLQETCFAMLAEVVERAMANTGKKELLLVGGVGANKRFCEMLDIMCKERGAKFFKVPMSLAGDQGAMIAWEGFLRQKESGDIEVNPHWRADEV